MMREDTVKPMSDLQVALRGISGKDVPGVLRQMRRLYEEDGDPFDEVATERTLREFISSPEAGRGWVILVEGQPAGYMILTFGYSLEFYGRDGCLDELYLDGSFRGRGVGRKALDYLLEESRKLGLVALHLEVERNNQAAKHLYVEMGFENRERYFLMSKRL